MAGLIIIRTEVHNSKIMEFLDVVSKWNIHIAKIYKYLETTEVIFNVELMGYAEPDKFFLDVEKYVIDVWYSCVGDVEFKAGKDCKGYGWKSCLKFKKKKEKELK